jgi:hypothetical protein
MSTFKSDLMDAVRDAVTNFNSGMADDAAVIKAASARDFNPQQTERLVESYNTAKTICMYKSAESRDSVFTTADKPAVMAGLFTPEAVKKATDDLDDYDYSRVNYDEYDVYRKVPIDMYEFDEKTASTGVDFELFEQGFTEDALMRSALNMDSDIQSASCKCASAAEMLEILADARMGKIASELSKSAWMHPGFAADVVTSIRMELPGAFGDSIASNVLSRLPAHLAKQASVEVDWPTCALTRPDILKEAAAAARELHDASNLRRQSGEIKTASNDFTRAVRDAAGFHIPAADPSDSLFAEGVLERGLFFKLSAADPGKDSDAKNKGEAQGVHTFVMDAHKTMLNNVSGASELVAGEKAMPMGAISKAVNEFVGPELAKSMAGVVRGPGDREASAMADRLDNVRRKLLLEDLIVNDPIISGADQNKVIAAYGTLLKTAPAVSLQKDVVRSVLREMVNTEAFSPYDAKNLIDLDMSVQKRTRMAKELRKPGTKVDVRI